MSKRFTTGHIDDTSIRTEHDTLEEAEQWIEQQAKLDPVGVDIGSYYIDDMQVSDSTN